MAEESASRQPVQLVVFAVAGTRVAIPLSFVHRVVMAAEVTPVPGAPPTVVGVLDFHGEVIPILDIRQRVRAEPQAPGVDNQFVIVSAGARVVGIVVDHSLGVIERAPDDIMPLAPAATGLEYFEGSTRLDDGLVLIHDMDKFLSPQEAEMLEAATAVVQ
jgi:purine-binding chemotaxis protein CheW